MNTSNLDNLLEKVYAQPMPDRQDLERLLSVDGGEGSAKIFSFADKVRREFMGDGILVRGIVEFSSFCRNSCSYCGLNKENTALKRYRLTAEEILDSIRNIAAHGIKTVVLQSGEDDGLDPEWLCRILRRIKSEFDIAVTLSVGERTRQEYKAWRESGADRYLLKIETSDKKLYEALHAGMRFENRIRCLGDLKELGYQTGSGVMVGLKGQSTASLAQDIIFFKKCDFDMIGIGPFIPHSSTRLSGEAQGGVALTLKMISLARIVTKNSHIPATTALGSAGGDFRIDALKAGANVLMPNFTPMPYKKFYEIYPNKRCVDESADLCVSCIGRMADSAGRTVDHSRGDSIKRDLAFSER